jgi:hypothetical protein
MFASLAGSLYATTLSSSVLEILILLLIQVVTMVIVGGMGSIWGPFWSQPSDRSLRNVRSGKVQYHRQRSYFDFGAYLSSGSSHGPFSLYQRWKSVLIVPPQKN